MVVVLSGRGPSHGENAMRGLRGRVLVANPRDGMVIVSGVNIIKRHTKPGRGHPQGGIIEREAPIRACKVQVVCPSCDKPTRIAHNFVQDPKRPDKKRKIRICKKCSATLDVT